MADVLPRRSAPGFGAIGADNRPAFDPRPRIGVERVEIVLFAVAMFLIIASGCGISLIALPRHHSINTIELLCLSFLLGAGFVSIASFTFGFFISGLALRLTVAALCLALLALGLRANPPQFDWRRALPARSKSDWALLVWMLAPIGLAAWVSQQRAMGWDGLFNWEIKARVAFLNGGAIPLSFYSDPTRPWTHPEYPLLLPLTEAWLYGWMGRADQAMVQALFLIFFAAALGLLYAGVSRFGFRSAQLWAPPVLLLAPQLIFSGQGGVSSGYADFPLAVFYLAAVIFLLEYWKEEDAGLLLPFGLLAGSLCWVKSEGAILWSCLIALAMIKTFRRRDWRKAAIAVLPGLIVLIGWRVFLLFAKPSTGEVFLPLTPSTLRNNLWRAPQIAQAVLAEMLNWRHWGPLWIVVVVAALFLILNSRRDHRVILPAAVFPPIAVYAGVYVFSAWDFLLHLNNSFPRLLTQVSIVAALTVAVVLPFGRARKDERDGSTQSNPSA